MKAIWMLLKVVVALVVAIPLAIIVLATSLGILGALVGVAVLALKLAFFGVVGWAAFRLIGRLVRGSSRGTTKSEPAALPAVDPHYEAAMKELDRELGHVPR